MAALIYTFSLILPKYHFRSCGILKSAILPQFHFHISQNLKSVKIYDHKMLQLKVK